MFCAFSNAARRFSGVGSILSALEILLDVIFLDSWGVVSAFSSQGIGPLGFSVSVVFPFLGAFSTSEGVLYIWVGVLITMQLLEKAAWSVSSSSLQVFDVLGIVSGGRSVRGL